MRPVRLLLLSALLAFGISVSSTAASSSGVLPPSFTNSLVASVAEPTALAFTPDGRMLVTSQPGVLYVVQAGQLLPTQALDLVSATCSQSERGLLGIAVDPAFADNQFIYLYYTADTIAGCVNRVARFTLSDDSVVDPASELILIDNIPSPGGNHNGGDLHFGKNGDLYVSVGDGGCDYDGDSGCQAANAAARDQNVLVGKVLRITSDGGIPADNPFQGSDSARCNIAGRTDPGLVCQETFVWGLRNPFRLAFDPNASDTRFAINDVGQDTWEEIDVAQAGADYGWNVREGFCATDSTTDCGPPPAGMTNPIFAYEHVSDCEAITAGAFVPKGIWPAAYDGAYLFADYLCGTIFQLVPAADGTFTATEFATGLGVGGPITMIFGPDGPTQSLYYTTYANGGQVRRIAFPTLTELSPVHAWIGLRNSDDQGAQFDLKVELLKNDTVVATGLQQCITGLTRSPSLATEATVSWDSFTPVPIESGDVLSLVISTRMGTTGTAGDKCSRPGGGHNSATGLRLYYDSTNRQSDFDWTIAPGANTNEYLHSDGNACANAESTGVTTSYFDDTASTTAAKCADSGAVSLSHGNPLTVIGTWSMTVP